MMIPFMFVINRVPLPENHDYETIGGAKIHIWVMDASLDSARGKAVSMVEQSHWSVQDIEDELEIAPEQVPLLDTVEVSLYSKALRDGISAMFVGYPKVDGNPDDPVVIGHP